MSVGLRVATVGNAARVTPEQKRAKPDALVEPIQEIRIKKIWEIFSRDRAPQMVIKTLLEGGETAIIRMINAASQEMSKEDLRNAEIAEIITQAKRFLYPEKVGREWHWFWEYKKGRNGWSVIDLGMYENDLDDILGRKADNIRKGNFSAVDEVLGGDAAVVIERVGKMLRNMIDTGQNLPDIRVALRLDWTETRVAGQCMQDDATIDSIAALLHVKEAGAAAVVLKRIDEKLAGNKTTIRRYGSRGQKERGRIRDIFDIERTPQTVIGMLLKGDVDETIAMMRSGFGEEISYEEIAAKIMREIAAIKDTSNGKHRYTSWYTGDVRISIGMDKQKAIMRLNELAEKIKEMGAKTKDVEEAVA